MFEKYLENTDYAPEDIEVSILVNEDSINKTKTAQYISKVFEDAGVKTSVESVDFDTYLQKISDGEFTLYIGQTTASLDQDFGFLAQSEKNMQGYSNAEMDKALENFRILTEVEDKKQAAGNVAKMFVDELPVISLYYMENTFISDSEISGEFLPMQTNLLGDISALKAKK